jgi:hypothetical protein
MSQCGAASEFQSGQGSGAAVEKNGADGIRDIEHVAIEGMERLGKAT